VAFLIWGIAQAVLKQFVTFVRKSLATPVLIKQVES
jgi:hypothetical protein